MAQVVSQQKLLRPMQTRELSYVYILFEIILETEEMLPGWRYGYLVKLSKEGQLQECDSYRRIIVLPVPEKILSGIIMKRLKDAIH